MVPASEYTARTKALYVEIRSMLKQAGYKYARTVQSAEETLSFSKGDSTIEISGWHGNGRYGYGKIAFAYYIDGNEFLVLDVLGMREDDMSCTGGAYNMYLNRMADLKVKLREILV